MPLPITHRQTIPLLPAALAAAASSGAGATARMGGALSTLASNGQCSFNRLVPLAWYRPVAVPDHTARATLQLPAGDAAFTSSSLPLVFAPVPEPANWALMALGPAVLPGRRRLAP